MKYGQLTQALNLVFEGRILADDETVEEANLLNGTSTFDDRLTVAGQWLGQGLPVFAHWLAA